MTLPAGYQVVFYKTREGKRPMEEFLSTVPENARGKIARWIDRLEIQGPNLLRPYADIVRGKIRELRVRFGNLHYRFLYFFAGKTIVLTHGFLKKDDKVPPAEIDRAERLMSDYFTRLERGEIK